MKIPVKTQCNYLYVQMATTTSEVFGMWPEELNMKIIEIKPVIGGKKRIVIEVDIPAVQ
jgi:hypothetical protein